MNMNPFRVHRSYSPAQWYIALARLEQLLSGGLPLALALDVVAQQIRQPALRAHFQQLHEQVKAGVSLSRALSAETNRALSTAQAGIAVAEQTGQLTRVMRSLVLSWQRQRQIQSLIKDATRYPLALLCMGILIVAIFLIWVLPTIQQLFADQSLPSLTQYLVDCVTWVTRHGHNLVMILCIIVVLVMLFYRLQRRRCQALMQRLPIWGTLQRLRMYQSTFEYLALGLRSGMSAVSATRMVAEHSTWLPMQHKLTLIAQALNDGNSWSHAFAHVGLIDPTIQAYLQTAEHVGRIDETVARLSEDFRQRVESYCEQLGIWLNPLLMVILTGIIGFMLLAMYLPIFSLTQQLA